MYYDGFSLRRWQPFQSSCLENPMDGGAWWAAVHGVAESLNTTERLHFHFSLSRIGEGNGNPLQCSCLENPRDGGAWWAAVYGVAQSQTRLKWFSSMAFHITVCYVAHHGGNISRQKLQGQFGTRLRHCPSRWSYSKKVMVSSDSRWAKRFNFQLVKCLSHTARGQAQKGKGNCCRNHYR